VRNLLLLLFLVSLLGLPYGVLLPVFAKEVLRGGVGVFGELGAASGAGALAGTLYMASRSSLKGLGGRLALAVLVFGLCLAAFSRTHSVALALCLQIPVGLGSGLLITGVQTLVQSLVRDDVRGRVMSFYTMSFMGTMPFGGLMFGYAAQRFGAPATILVGGLACTVAGAYFWIRLPHFHSHAGPILSAKGVL
jgi:MFS family permease